MGRLIGVLCMAVLLLGLAPGASAAPSEPTVKAVALAFGEAILHNDGGTALSLLAPDLRRHTAANQLPLLLGVQSPPTGVHVVRWAYNNGVGDATLALTYPKGPVAEHLFVRLYKEGWRIAAIAPEDPLTLQRGAETAVVAFCDAAVRGDAVAMRAVLTAKLAAKVSTAQVPGLLSLPGGTPISYMVRTYAGGPAGASVVVQLRSDTAVVSDMFAVINDRDGWRIASIDVVPGR